MLYILSWNNFINHSHSGLSLAPQSQSNTNSSTWIKVILFSCFFKVTLLYSRKVSTNHYKYKRSTFNISTNLFMASWSTAWHIIETKKNPKILQTQMNTEKLTVKLNSTAVFEINNGPFTITAILLFCWANR